MQEFISISILILLAAISPGPDFALVSKNALLYSRRSGIYTAAGVSISILIHAIYSIFGLALIISQSLLAFSIIKYLGAAYLIYIGFKSLIAKDEKTQLELNSNRKILSDRQAFTQGLLCNLLNPKAVMFILAFFTLVVKPGETLAMEWSYGLEIALIHMIWFSTLACMLTHPVVQTNLNRVQFYIIKAMGVLLIAFGVKIATLGQISLSEMVLE